MSDRALRRLVADLAARPEADISAVLNALPASHRPRVSALLGEFSGRTRAGDTSTDVAGAPQIEGLSRWLGERLGPARQGGGESFSMTPLARDTLRASVADLQPAAAADARGHSLFTRLRSVVGPAR